MRPWTLLNRVWHHFCAACHGHVHDSTCAVCGVIRQCVVILGHHSCRPRCNWPVEVQVPRGMDCCCAT